MLIAAFVQVFGHWTEWQREETVIIGDRMDTGIIAGIDTVLVLSGITKESDLDLYPYRPHYILKDISEICT